MPSHLQWLLLDATVAAGSRGAPSEEFLRPYLEAAYAGVTPWHSADSPLGLRTREFLLETMASHAQTAEQMLATVDAFDSALGTRSEAWVTARAGEALVRRAKAGELPDGWSVALQSMAFRSDRPSAGYWSRAILRAGGLSAPEKDLDDGAAPTAATVTEGAGVA